LVVYFGFSQTYKILISYDANVNRIKRERVCVGCPSPIMILSQKVSNGVNLYPNPAKTQCFVQVPLEWLAQEGQCRIVVTDATGKIMQTLNVTQTLSTLNFSGYADATYLVTIFLVSERKFSEQVVKLTS
ncbi:MAG: T9SS type A sorting domain-containing protein, partial [Sphingobacteriales bacterium]